MAYSGDVQIRVSGMSSGFEINRESVEQYASRMRIHGEDYAAALQRLKERGLGGTSWGDDGLLSMLVRPYAEATALGLEAMTGLSTVIGETGDGLSGVASNTRAAEEANVRETLSLNDDRWA
jgi:hypothetical protein